MCVEGNLHFHKQTKMNGESASSNSIDMHEESKGIEEEEEEEVLVYVQFEDHNEANTLLKAIGKRGGEIKQLINTAADAQPTCVVDGITFSGQHQINLGTVLFFGAKKNDRSNKVELVGSTERVLKFSKQTVKPMKKDTTRAESSMEVDTEVEEGVPYSLV